MSELTGKHCQPCDGSTVPLSGGEATRYLRELQNGWRLTPEGTGIQREWRFKNFYRTMSFVNAAAHVANVEDHHPDLEVGYGYCRVKFTTHAIKGLSENDFICAAQLDALPLG